MKQERHIAIVTLMAFAAVMRGCAMSLKVDNPLKKESAATQPAKQSALADAIQVPAAAKLIGQGNDRISYTAQNGGTVYVFSRDERQVSLQYDLQPGEGFVLTPGTKGTQFVADHHNGGGAGTIPPSKGGYEVYFLNKGPAVTSSAPTTASAPRAP